jgi:hypothetical protein
MVRDRHVIKHFSSPYYGMLWRGEHHPSVSPLMDCVRHLMDSARHATKRFFNHRLLS